MSALLFFLVVHSSSSSLWHRLSFIILLRRYRTGGPGSAIAWVFGAFNVFMLTMVTVNMFVAAVTTIFMDQRSVENPDGAAAARPRTPRQQEMDARSAGEMILLLAASCFPNVKLALTRKSTCCFAEWTKPFYYVAPFGGEGPFVEPMRAGLGEIKGNLAEAEEEEAKWAGSRASDIPKIELLIGEILLLAACRFPKVNLALTRRTTCCFAEEKLSEIRNAGGSERDGAEDGGGLAPEKRTGIINQPLFDQFILGFIMINTVALGMEHHDRTQCIPMQLSAFADWGMSDKEPSLHGMSEDGSELCQSPDFIANMKLANYVFNFVFTVECLLKIFGMGFREYIRVAFNKLDFFIVVTSALDMLGEALSEPGEGSGPSIFKLFRVFRLFRVLRVARILYRNQNLKRVLVTVFGSGESLINLTLFITFSILLFSILGMHLISGAF